MHPVLLLLITLFLCCSCSDDFGVSSRIPTLKPDQVPLEVEEGWVSPGDQLRLAARLLSTPITYPSGPGVETPGPNGNYRRELTDTGEQVLRYLLLESGAGVDVLWSPFVEDRAADETAPVDGNGQGGNLDETLKALRETYAFRANAVYPQHLGQSFLLPGFVPDKIQGIPADRQDYGALRAVADPRKEVPIRIGDLGSVMRAACMQASRLLRKGRGDFDGATAEEGVLGLLFLEKALAAESLLLRSLSWDGQALGRFADPAKYDPKVAARIFPSRLVYRPEDAGAVLGRKPVSFRVVDRASTLEDQARLLRGFAELAWLADPNQKHPLLARLFQGDPFGTKPTVPGGQGLDEPQAETISWDKHVKGLLNKHCSGCHSGSSPSGDFSVESYSLVLKGGKSNAKNPMVVKGDHLKSLLWQITAQESPPVAWRMPSNGPYLTPAEQKILADWIDEGLVEKDPGAGKEPLRHGLDGLRIVLANLVAQHQDPGTKAFVDRADLDGGRSQLMRPGPTGEVLMALAVAAKARPDLTEIKLILAEASLTAAEKLTDFDGRIFESYDLGRSQASETRAAIGPVASLVGGLFAAYQVIGAEGLRFRARAATERIKSEYLIPSYGLRNFPGSVYRRVSPSDMADLLEAMSWWYASEKDLILPGLLRELFEGHKSFGLLLAEWPSTGEKFGDGLPDTDKDGAVEVGVGGRAPLFASAVQNYEARLGRGIPARAPHWGSDVLPVLQPACGSCHMGGSSLGGFAIDSYKDLFFGGEYRQRTQILVPGRPDLSFFQNKVDGRNPAFGAQMPQGLPPLSPELRNLIRAWIQAGARKD
jgi:Planctomycete cytochrome C